MNTGRLVGAFRRVAAVVAVALLGGTVWQTGIEPAAAQTDPPPPCGGLIHATHAAAWADCDLLLSIKADLEGTGGGTLNWDRDTSINEWTGIAGTFSFDAVGVMIAAQVKGLGLPNLNLRGFIPPGLGNLSNLRKIDLSGNQLSRAIPLELGNLGELEVLNLSNNGWFLTTEEWDLDLDGRRGLSGKIPKELGRLTNLRFLYLDRNELTGTIPSKLGNLGQLEELS